MRGAGGGWGVRAGGVEMTDIVSYELPMGFLGRMMHPIIVKKKLEEIFDFRFKAVEHTIDF